MNDGKTIMRVIKNNNYMVLDKTFIHNPNLSLKAKGLLTYFLSLPDTWKIYLSELTNHHEDGRDSISSTIKELERKGYVTIEKTRNEKGHFNCIYTVFEVAQDNKTVTETTETNKPNGESLHGTTESVNTTLVINNKVNNNKVINNKVNNNKVKDIVDLKNPPIAPNDNKSKTFLKAQNIINIYNTIANGILPTAKTNKISDNRIKTINNLLKNYTEEDFTIVFNNLVNNNWYIGKNDRQWTANLDYIIREEKFIKFLEIVDNIKKEKTKSEIYGDTSMSDEELQEWSKNL